MRATAVQNFIFNASKYFQMCIKSGKCDAELYITGCKIHQKVVALNDEDAEASVMIL